MLIIKYLFAVMQGKESCVSATSDFFLKLETIQKEQFKNNNNKTVDALQ